MMKRLKQAVRLIPVFKSTLKVANIPYFAASNEPVKPRYIIPCPDASLAH